MIHVGGKTYEVITDHKNGWNPEVFRDRYSEVLERYDYIVGDWGYSQLRLRGFFKENNPKATKESSIACLQDYLNEYCNFGCAYFVIEKIAQKNTTEDGDEENGFSLHEETSSLEDGPPVYGVRAERPQQAAGKPAASSPPPASVSSVKPQQRPPQEKGSPRQQQGNPQAGKQGMAPQQGAKSQPSQQQAGKPNAKQQGQNGAGKAPSSQAPSRPPNGGGKPQYNQPANKRQPGKSAPSAPSVAGQES